MTDRRELEILASLLRTKGRAVEFIYDENGYIRRVSAGGAERTPLCFAEWARQQVAELL